MNILVLGTGKQNFNYRKIEGFYNSFSKIGETEWVDDIKKCSKKTYDIVFGEVSINYLINNIDFYNKLDIKNHIFWATFDIDILKKLADLRKDIKFLNAYKSNIFDKNIVNNYISKHGPNYMKVGDEGVDLGKFNSNPIGNLKFCYLPCSLSEKDDEFLENKNTDICYFGTIHNRPHVAKVLEQLSKKYKVITNCWDVKGIVDPEFCFNFYKNCKITLSESANPVLLEYPVRLGESTANGCRLFLYEHIPLKTDNILIPEHTYTSDYVDLIEKIEDYLDNFTIDKSYNLYNNFTSTYDNAVDFIIKQIN